MEDDGDDDDDVVDDEDIADDDNVIDDKDNDVKDSDNGSDSDEKNKSIGEGLEDVFSCPMETHFGNDDAISINKIIVLDEVEFYFFLKQF